MEAAGLPYSHLLFGQQLVFLVFKIRAPSDGGDGCILYVNVWFMMCSQLNFLKRCEIISNWINYLIKVVKSKFRTIKNTTETKYSKYSMI